MPFEPAPLHVDTSRVVEGVHEYPTIPDQPDFASRQEMEAFLEERIQGDQSGLRQRFGRWRAYTPVERTRPRFDRWAYLHAHPDVDRRLVTDGRSWRRVSLAGTLAATAIFNLVGGNVASVIDDVAEEISQFKDNFQDARKISDHEICVPDTSTTVTFTTNKQTETFYFSPNKVGESNPEVSIIDKILDRVEAAKADGTVTGIEVDVKANASDEWLGLGPEQNFGYGQDEPKDETLGNEALGSNRVVNEAQMLRERAVARGINLSGIEVIVTHKQNTLDGEILAGLQTLVETFGYGSIDEVQRIHNTDPESLPEDVLQAFDRHFTRNRDTALKLTVTQELSTTVTAETPGEQEDCVLIDGKPKDENNDYDWPIIPFLWPALPLFMKKRITKMKGFPIDVGDLQDPQKLLIHRDGVLPNRELDQSAWAYVRKFMYLFREDGRITKIFEHGYSGEDGKEQSLRAIFVDHEPTQESVDMVARMFEFASQIQGGRLGRECDAVVIYPSGNAGLHGYAKKVGLGMDVQYEGSTLGVANPSLRIVEMHTPEIPTDGALDQDYNSTAWVIAHELEGHFSDLNDEPNLLLPAGQNANGKTVYTLPNRFANSSMGQYRRGNREQERANGEAGGRIRRFFGRTRGADSMRWAVRRGRGTLPTPDAAEPVTQTIHGTDDIRLTEALRVKKQTGNPSRYGSSMSHHSETTAAAEAHAEAAANMATGIPVPFSNAPEYAARGIRAEDPSLFIDGYDVSRDWNDTLDQRWGSVTANEQTTFPNQADAEQHWTRRLDVPENFEWARELAAWARSVEIPEPTHAVWEEIIVGQAIRQQIAAERAKRKIFV